MRDNKNLKIKIKQLYQEKKEFFESWQNEKAKECQNEIDRLKNILKDKKKNRLKNSKLFKKAN